MPGEQEALRAEALYSPLSTRQVEAAGMPPPSEPDAYLRARIQRFYAELQVEASASASLPRAPAACKPEAGRMCSCLIKRPGSPKPS